MPFPIFTPTRCHVSLGAIMRNFQKLGQPDRLMPVIKSDAYGHGLLSVADALARAGAIRFAVGLASEGAALRKAGFKQDIILLMGCLDRQDWQTAITHQLTPIIGSARDAQCARAACGSRDTLNFAIKCDTGMGRLGFAAEDAAQTADLFRNVSQLRPKLVISHLACADMPEHETFTQSQIARFRNFYGHMADVFPGLKRCLGNSAATLEHLEDDISRPGLAIYGGNPFGPESCGLEWAMSVSSAITHVHTLRQGDSLSYGRIFTAPRDVRVAVVAAGYASGYNRQFSNRAEILVHGRRCRQIGRICMSMCMADVSNVPEAAPGDTAWIMGGPKAGDAAPVDAWELASMLDTIPYELLCIFGGMNPRVYSDA